MKLTTITEALLATTLSVSPAYADLPKYLTDAINESVNKLLSTPIPETNTTNTTTQPKKPARTYIDDLVDNPSVDELNLKPKAVEIPTKAPKKYKVTFRKPKRSTPKFKSSK